MYKACLSIHTNKLTDPKKVKNTYMKTHAISWIALKKDYKKGMFMIFISVLLFEINQNGYCQSAESENLLRKQNTDTINGWKKGGIIVANLSQTSLSNWAGGGQNSLSVNGIISVFANYKAEKSFWNTSLDIGYGVLKQGKNSHAMKTDDKIDLLSKYGTLAFNKWYYAILVNFKTQMSAGYNYPNDSSKISNFMAPAYLITALGLDYKPNNYFSLFVAPVTSKIIIVNDQNLANTGSFGVDPATFDTGGNLVKKGKKAKSEIGAYLRVIYAKNDFKTDLLKNMSFSTKLDLYSNYLDNPQNIVVNWETLLTMNVNKFISVNFNTNLIYDDKIVITEKLPDGTIVNTGPRIQFKELLGVGISYKF